MVEGAASRAIRLLDLVPFLVSHPGISVAALAKEFEISKEEILKDLNLLFMCGLPGYTPLELIDISFDDEVVVVRDPQNLQSPRNLTESESLALRIALSALLESTPRSNPMHDKIEQLARKIAGAFGSEIPSGAIDFTTDHESRVLRTVENAIKERADLEIEYLNKAKDEFTQRRITPMFITAYPNRKILSGYCHVARAERSFVLSQINSARLVPKLSAELSKQSYEDSFIHVVISVNNLECSFYKDNEKLLKKIDGDAFALEVFQDEWIIRTIVSDPDSLELLKPQTLRESVRERAIDALHAYGVIG